MTDSLCAILRSDLLVGFGDLELSLPFFLRVPSSGLDFPTW